MGETVQGTVGVQGNYWNLFGAKGFPRKAGKSANTLFVLDTHLVDLANIYVISSVCLIGSLANDLRCG